MMVVRLIAYFMLVFGITVGGAGLLARWERRERARQSARARR